MSKRKINVDKLTTEQFETAQTKISEKIDTEINTLLGKWNPVLKKYNKICVIEIAVDEESKINVSDKENDDFFSAHFDSETLGTIAKELDSISREMTKDLNLAITNCNQLLSRYGMACNMAFAEKAE